MKSFCTHVIALYLCPVRGSLQTGPLGLTLALNTGLPPVLIEGR